MEYKKDKKKFPLVFQKKWEKQLLPTKLEVENPADVWDVKNGNGQNEAVKLAIKQ